MPGIADDIWLLLVVVFIGLNLLVGVGGLLVVGCCYATRRSMPGRSVLWWVGRAMFAEGCALFVVLLVGMLVYG